MSILLAIDVLSFGGLQHVGQPRGRIRQQTDRSAGRRIRDESDRTAS
jgi:hypothetical protein